MKNNNLKSGGSYGNIVKTMRKVFFPIVCVVILIMCTVLAGCGKNIDESEVETTSDSGSDEISEVSGDALVETAYPVTITDDYDNEVTIESEPTSIVTLGPCETEIVCALGAIDRLKGRTEVDNYPEEVAKIQSVGEYYEPNIELIVSISPDLVISANYLSDDLKGQLDDAGIAVYMCYDGGLDQTEQNIINIGKLINANVEAEELISDMETLRSEIVDKCSTVQEPKSVFIDIGDYYSAGKGSLLDDMLTEINCVNIAGDSDSTWPQLSLEQIIAADPDVYISFYSSKEEILEMPGMSAVSAVVNDCVYCFDMYSDESDMMQRSGPRIMEGLEIMAKTIYPELF